MFSLQTSRVWADVAYQAVTSLGPALVTALVSIVVAWLAFRSQLKLKDREIESQTRLKARELMFNSYQGLLERREKSALEIGGILGSMGVAFQLTNDPQEQVKTRLALMKTMGEILMPLRGSIGQIESELSRTGLIDKYRNEVSFIKDRLTLDLMRIPYDEIPKYYADAMTLLSYSALIQQHLLERKREELFSEYLPK